MLQGNFRNIWLKKRSIEADNAHVSGAGNSNFPRRIDRLYCGDPSSHIPHAHAIDRLPEQPVSSQNLRAFFLIDVPGAGADAADGQVCAADGAVAALLLACLAAEDVGE